MWYSYKKAKEQLSAGEKDRLLSIFLSKEDPVADVDWKTCTATYGSASIDSMRVSTRNAMKKIVVDTKEAAAEAYVPDPATPGTGEPAAKKAGGGRKRKAAAAAASADDNSEEPDNLATPTPAKRSRKPKAKPAPTDNGEEEEGEDDKKPKKRARKSKHEGSEANGKIEETVKGEPGEDDQME